MVAYMSTHDILFDAISEESCTLIEQLPHVTLFRKEVMQTLKKFLLHIGNFTLSLTHIYICTYHMHTHTTHTIYTPAH